MKAIILQETFSIENVSLSNSSKEVFLSIKERDTFCNIYRGKGPFKCLQIDTSYNPQETGILEKMSMLFSKNNISIFAFTSIDHGYFFFEEKLQKRVEMNILHTINNY